MKNQEISKFKIRLEVIKGKSNHSRIPNELKDNIIKGLTELSEDISKFFGDASISENAKIRLEKKTRKKIMVINQLIDELDSILKMSVDEGI